MLITVLKSLQLEFDLSQAETKAQYMFWDKMLNELADKQFEDGLAYHEKEEIAQLFNKAGIQYRNMYAGFPIYK